MRFLKFHILHADDTPHRIALGAGMGLFVAWMPALGLHMLIVLALSMVIKVNKFVALISVWISNPFTIVGIYYPNYLVGRAVVGVFHDTGQVSGAQLREFLDLFKLTGGLAPFFSSQFWQDIFSFLWQKVPELWIGSLIMGVWVGTVGYFLTYYVVVEHRRKHPRREKMKKNF